ncbi:hypothetical protein KY285_027430 [Solanum tuberosum]|nr:hypothetical protein KY289_029710 [Solanum tuberosum]KAH0666224.1 hypothetical protein KY285_027430 [Solanum tuberosum]
MKMWPETNNPRIEPPEPKQMPGTPSRNRRKSKDEPRKKYGKMSKQEATTRNIARLVSILHNQLATVHNLLLVKVHKELCIVSIAIQITSPSLPNLIVCGCYPEPINSYQPGPTKFNQHASTTSNNHASSTTVCGDISIVKRARETAKSSQPPPFADTSIPVTRGINSQLPPRTRQTTGQKREKVATGEDFARGGSKRSTNDGSSNVGFGTTQVQPGTSSQRILPTGSSYKDASLTGIDLGFKPRGLRWKNKNDVTNFQLQQMANKKKK